MNPFFSICVPSTNREATIFETLKSISLQKFSDFEVIISDCNSTDNTREEIKNFLNSNHFKNNTFNYQLQYLDYTPKTVEDWNEPLNIAKGKYIAMLEGDDQFLPNHLQQAYNDLSSQKNIGLYFPGNKYKRQTLGKEKGYNQLYSLKSIPAPSETIFKRTNRKNIPYYYNVTEYNYCPEIELYLTICKSYDIFYSGVEGVIRDETIKSRAKWRYYRDHFYIADKFKTNVTNKLFSKTINEIKTRAIKAIIYDHFTYKIPERKELKKQLKLRFGIYNYYLSLIKGYGLVSLIFFKKKFQKK